MPPYAWYGRYGIGVPTRVIDIVLRWLLLVLVLPRPPRTVFSLDTRLLARTSSSSPPESLVTCQVHVSSWLDRDPRVQLRLHSARGAGRT